MDALNEWNNLTPGYYKVYFMNNEEDSIAVDRFIINGNGGTVYMIDINGVVYNWNNVLKLEKIADLQRKA